MEHLMTSNIVKIEHLITKYIEDGTCSYLNIIKVDYNIVHDYNPYMM